MAIVNQIDLRFILAEILLAEAGQPTVDPRLVRGLRQVAGATSQDVPGQCTFEAADERFPRVGCPLFSTGTLNLVGKACDPHPDATGEAWTSRPGRSSTRASRTGTDTPAFSTAEALPINVAVDRPAGAATGHAGAAHVASLTGSKCTCAAVFRSGYGKDVVTDLSALAGAGHAVMHLSMDMACDTSGEVFADARSTRELGHDRFRRRHGFDAEEYPGRTRLPE